MSKLYSCSECRMNYRDPKIARKCREWCKKYRSCNLEIIKHAVNE